MSQQTSFDLRSRSESRGDAFEHIVVTVHHPVRVNQYPAGRQLGQFVGPPAFSTLPKTVMRLPPAPGNSPREAFALNGGGDPWARPVLPQFASVHVTAPALAESPATSNKRPQQDSRETVAVHPRPTKTARRKAQCRANQARYRERQRKKKSDAEEETACLRELVALLELHRSLMRATRDPDFEYAHHLITSFFRHFRRGVAGASMEDIASSEMLLEATPRWTKVGRAGRNATLLKQIAFVQCVVSEEAELGGSSKGPDELLEQCWRYSALHSNPWVQLMSIERASSSSPEVEHIVATAQVVVEITKQTLATVFPGLSSRLQRKLLGKKVEYSFQFDLEFAREGLSLLLQLVWATARIDVVGAFMALLRDPVAVDEVLRCARISMHGCIGGW